MLNQLNYPLDLNKAVQWNKPVDNNVRLAFECKDHPKVRHTSYLEVYDLIGTSGCSNNKDMWDWSVMGVLEDNRGNKLIVNPGDWIIEDSLFTVIVSDELFQKTYNNLKNPTY